MTNEPRRRPEGCASDLELEELIAGDLAGGPDEARTRAHVEGCSRCRERRSALAAAPALAPDAAAWRPVLEASAAATATGAGAAAVGGAAGAARPRRRRVATLAGAALAVAGAAAAVFVLRPPGGVPAPGDHAGEGAAGDRVKGSLALTIHVRRANGAVDRLAAAGVARPGDEMRFEITTARAGQAVVLGLDARPSVTTYVPAAGSATGPVRVEPTGPAMLDGSVTADDTLGFERVFALVCPPAVASLESLRQRATQALASAGGHPEAVSSLGTGCLETSVLITKRAR